MDLSIIIPTMNRSDFISRLFEYYKSIEFDGFLFIGDSSIGLQKESVKKLVDYYKDKLKIKYTYFPPKIFINNSVCIAELLQFVSTKYAVFSGDDDFLVPEALDDCIKFLNKNIDYASARGKRVEFKLDHDGAFGNTISFAWVHQAELESNSSVDRWIAYMRNAVSTQYFVHRTNTWKEMYKNVNKIKLNYIGTELLPCSVSALSGKSKELNRITCFFQDHDDYFTSWSANPFYKSLLDSDWNNSVNIFKNTILDYLKNYYEDEKKAEDVFDKEMWYHLLVHLSWQYDVTYNNPSRKKIAGLRSLSHYTIDFIFNLVRKTLNLLTVKKVGKISMDNFLKLGGAYYDCFHPIQKIICNTNIK